MLHLQPRIGKLWEQKTTQQQPYDFTHTQSKTRFTFPEAQSLEISSSTHDSTIEYGVHEQRPAFASQIQENELLFHEDNAPGWKATNYPHRKVPKGWLALVALVALLFFMMGLGMAERLTSGMKTVLSSSPHPMVSKPAIVVQTPAQQINMWPPAHTFYFFMNPTFTGIATKEVATALHLNPEQITIKIVNANYGLSAVAGDQGIFYNQLYFIEQRAVNDMLDAEITAGYIRPEEASAWKNLFWSDPAKLDNVVGSMFSGLPVDISF